MQISKENVTSSFKMVANLQKSVNLMFIHFCSSELIFQACYLHDDVFMRPIDLTVACTKTRARKAIFASQGFRSRSPLSSPLADWARFVIPADRHLAVFTCPAYKDDITFDQWVLLTVSCLGRCTMAAPSVFDCMQVMFPWSIVSGYLIGHMKTSWCR